MVLAYRNDICFTIAVFTDPSLRKSLSMSQLVDANKDVVSTQNGYESGSNSKPFVTSASIPTMVSHQKSISYDLQSPGSCNVFMSDRDVSIDDPYTDHHRLLGKTSSEGSHRLLGKTSSEGSRTDKSASVYVASGKSLGSLMHSTHNLNLSVSLDQGFSTRVSHPWGTRLDFLKHQVYFCGVVCISKEFNEFY